ncbi:hypothetical protein EZS27_026091 [termite gut metagenome]|uniref:Uncharacterized protein n=1 Tax=termite gut metagenome TaxID=433724 RepID=A0A5J4QUY9_9ZZZZ
MKKFILLIIALISFLSISSCEKDREDTEGSNNSYVDQRLETFSKKLTALDKQLSLISSDDIEVMQLVDSQKKAIASLTSLLEKADRENNAIISQITLEYLALRGEFDSKLSKIDELLVLTSYYPDREDMALLNGLNRTLELNNFHDLAHFVWSYSETKKEVEKLRDIFLLFDLDDSNAGMLWSYIKSVELHLGYLIEDITLGKFDDHFIEATLASLKKEGYLLSKSEIETLVTGLIEQYNDSINDSTDPPVNNLVDNIEIIKSDYVSINKGLVHDLPFIAEVINKSMVFGELNPIDFSAMPRFIYTRDRVLYLSVSPANTDLTTKKLSLIDSNGVELSEVKLTCTKEEKALGLESEEFGIFKVTLSLPKTDPGSLITFENSALNKRFAIKISDDDGLNVRTTSLNIIFSRAKSIHHLDTDCKDFRQAWDETSIDYTVTTPMETREVSKTRTLLPSFTLLFTGNAWEDHLVSEGGFNFPNKDMYKAIVDPTESFRWMMHSTDSEIASFHNYPIYWPPALGKGETLTIKLKGSSLNCYKYYIELQPAFYNGDENKVLNNTPDPYHNQDGKLFTTICNNITGKIGQSIDVTEEVSITLTNITKDMALEYFGINVVLVNYDGTLVDPDGKSFLVKIKQ